MVEADVNCELLVQTTVKLSDANAESMSILQTREAARAAFQKALSGWLMDAKKLPSYVGLSSCVNSPFNVTAIR